MCRMIRAERCRRKRSPTSTRRPAGRDGGPSAAAGPTAVGGRVRGSTVVSRLADMRTPLLLLLLHRLQRCNERPIVKCRRRIIDARVFLQQQQLLLLQPCPRRQAERCRSRKLQQSYSCRDAVRSDLSSSDFTAGCLLACGGRCRRQASQKIVAAPKRSRIVSTAFVVVDFVPLLVLFTKAVDHRTYGACSAVRTSVADIRKICCLAAAVASV